MFDTTKIKGIIEITRYENGIIDEVFTIENLITDKGVNYLAKMVGGTITGINKIGLGDNNTVASKADLSLYNRTVLVDVTKDYSADKIVRFLAKIPENTFTFTANYKEIGLIYKSSTEDILITRAVFQTPIFQKAENSLSLSYSLIFAN